MKRIFDSIVSIKTKEVQVDESKKSTYVVEISMNQKGYLLLMNSFKKYAKAKK